MTYDRHIVITVHGIRTYGQWQNALASMLTERAPNTEVHNYHYGYFSVIAFLIPPLRWLVTRRFSKQLAISLHGADNARIDLVGHSFGTHLIGWALKRLPVNACPNIHTVLMAGSVLTSDFDWSDLLRTGKLKRVVNDCGSKDSILIINQIFVLGTGMAGRLGFHGMMGKQLTNRFFVGGHSHYFESAECDDHSFMARYWLPVLLENAEVKAIDLRPSATALQGITTTLLQNTQTFKLALYTVILLSPALLFFNLYQEAEVQRLIAERQTVAALEAKKEAVLSEHKALRAENEARHQKDGAINTLVWVFNEAAVFPYDRSDMPNNRWLQLISGALERLAELKIEQDIILESHIGKFVFIPDSIENIPDGGRLATTSDREMNRETSSYSREYALAISQRIGNSIRAQADHLFPPHKFEVIGYGLEKPLVPYPDNSNDLSTWNEIAEWNNRVIMVLE
ncbi:hypothetical protein EYC98_18650 [Halieaceae bacterium IMCC14734]|uniref:Alpha/beta hydrolase n=1 Tax=Candidatus Litorirhabdus singularis TaxID=2518993 RepID=A0ABT3TKM5_9GAMM|nr:hypothetical protein [Candidatus Litorirhabdus singularis]MCX2982887.1 hypothetical protein [Candidatus Litorirhabdus singularis]